MTLLHPNIRDLGDADPWQAPCRSAWYGCSGESQSPARGSVGWSWSGAPWVAPRKGK